MYHHNKSCGLKGRHNPCSYLAGILDHIDCPSLRVGGVEDHVHLFFGLSRTRTIADLVETVKTS